MCLGDRLLVGCRSSRCDTFLDLARTRNCFQARFDVEREDRTSRVQCSRRKRIQPKRRGEKRRRRTVEQRRFFFKSNSFASRSSSFETSEEKSVELERRLSSTNSNNNQSVDEIERQGNVQLDHRIGEKLVETKKQIRTIDEKTTPVVVSREIHQTGCSRKSSSQGRTASERLNFISKLCWSK